MVVANGKAVCTIDGIKGPGEKISENDFQDGKRAFDAHVKAGRIVKESKKGKEADQVIEIPSEKNAGEEEKKPNVGASKK